MSVELKILPPEIDFNILVVTCPTLGFFVFAETAIPTNGTATLTAGFKNLFQAVCVPLKTTFSLLLIEPSSSLFFV